jgi:hypothetical protein
MSAFDSDTDTITNTEYTITNIEDISNIEIKNNIEDTSNTEDIKSTTEVKSIFKIELDVLKSEIEKAVNPKTIEESMYLLSNPDKLISIMQQGANMFKEKTGRNMTYSELREMYG